MGRRDLSVAFDHLRQHSKLFAHGQLPEIPSCGFLAFDDLGHQIRHDKKLCRKTFHLSTSPWRKRIERLTVISNWQSALRQ
jgi:hypothetical protein